MRTFDCIAILLLAFGFEASVSAQASPNDGRVVRLVPECSPGFFVGLPSYMEGEKKVFIVGLAVDGDSATLEKIKAAIAEQGWESGTVTPPGRPMMLSIPAREKSTAAVFELFSRLSKAELGKVGVKPMLEPEPTKKCGADD